MRDFRSAEKGRLCSKLHSWQHAGLIALATFSLVILVGCNKNSASTDDRERYEEWLNYPECSWGPDAFVYFSYIGDTVGNAAGMYRIPISGQGGPEFVGPFSGPHYPSARVSPCGDWLAYVYLTYPGRAAIWIKDLTQPNVATGKTTRVKEAAVGEIAWLGCDTILYNTANRRIWMLDIATGEDKELYPWEFDFISATPDGRLIALSNTKQVLTVSAGQLDTVRVAISDSVDWFGGIRVSPDGRFIAYDHYTAPMAGNWWGVHIEIADAKTGTLQSSIPLSYHPVFTGDGRLVYVSLVTHKLYQLWIQDAQSNRRMLISRFQFPGMTHGQPANEFPKRSSRTQRKKIALAKTSEVTSLVSSNGGPAVSVFEIPVGDTGRVAESAFCFGG